MIEVQIVYPAIYFYIFNIRCTVFSLETQYFSCCSLHFIKEQLFIEDITRWREDMNYERAQRVSKILFLPRENKIHIFKPPCNVLFII